MALDSYYGSKSLETAKKDSLDSIKKLYFDKLSFESLIDDIEKTMKESRTVDRTSVHGIDQEWVRKNEGKDMIYAEPSKEPAEEEFQEMKLDKDIQAMLDRMDNAIIGQNKNTTRDVQAATVARDNYINELENLYNSIGSAFEESKPKEDFTAQIEEVKQSINKKSEYIRSELSNVYNNATVIAKRDELRQDLDTIMSQNNNDLDDLQNQEQQLDDLISRFAKLQTIADEIKATDDFKAQQQGIMNNNIITYQNNLVSKYGRYWFGQMNEQEKEEYIQMYMAAHSTSRAEVEKMIEDSINKAYEEMASMQVINNQEQGSGRGR